MGRKRASRRIMEAELEHCDFPWFYRNVHWRERRAGGVIPRLILTEPAHRREKRISSVAGRTEPCSVFSGCLGRCKCVALKPWILRCFWIEPELTNEPTSLNFFSAVPELERLILVFLRQHLMTLPYRFGIWASHPKKNPKKQKSLASFETRLPLCIGELDSTQ